MVTKFGIKLAIVLLCAVAGTILFSFTGLFIVPKYELATSCDTCVLDGEVIYPQTFWYWRGKTGYPFVSSDGGNLMRLKEDGYSFAERIKTSVEMRTAAYRRKMIKLPYSEFLYKVTTGGKPPRKYDADF